jgi:uncharacterized protein YidB (DUF937 family)
MWLTHKELGTQKAGAHRGHASPGVEAVEKEYHLMGLILELARQHGGVDGLQKLFADRGFGNEFASWVGFEANREIAPGQLEEVFGKERLAELAPRFELAPSQAAGLLAYYLPKVVDYLTPGGETEPHQDLAGFLVALLNGGFDQMLAEKSTPPEP